MCGRTCCTLAKALIPLACSSVLPGDIIVQHLNRYLSQIEAQNSFRFGVASGIDEIDVF